MSVKIDPGETWLYRIGGLAALAIGVGYIPIIVLYVPMGTQPHGAELWLAYLAGQTAAWWTILGLSVVTDLLYLPLAWSLYVALRPVNRHAMLLAATCMVLFVILDLTLTWTNYAVGIALGEQYVQATDDAGKAAIVAAAQYPFLMIESPLLFFYNSFILAIGILTTGLVMLKAMFSRSAALLGIATGILGVVAVVGSVFVSALSAVIIAASVLTLVWLLLVGYRLVRLGQSGANI